MSDSILKTKNLRLIPNAPEHLLALLRGKDPFQSSFGFSPAPGLRELFALDEISPEWIQNLKKAAEPNIWSDGFALVLDATNEVIGFAGFKGDPTLSSTVEISYGIVPMHQRKGYATEAARALFDYAVHIGRANLVLAHTLKDGTASQRVLQKCGFQLVGEVVDPHDGPVLQWEKRPS